MGYKQYRDFTEELYERWIEEGRGTGECESFISWIQSGDVPTKKGHFERYMCSKSGRMAVLLSGVESLHRLLFDSCANVAYVHEQVPLDREVTRRIARTLGVEHPRDDDTRVDVVMTTDHLVHVRLADGQLVKYPRSSKSHTQVASFNDAEHAEIERLYWLEQGVRPWKMLTDSPTCMPQVLKDNLEKLKACRTPPHNDEFPGQHALQCREVKAALLAAQHHISVGRFCADLDVKLGYRPGAASKAFLYLVFNHELKAHLHLQPLFNQDVQEIANLTRAGETPPEGSRT